MGEAVVVLTPDGGGDQTVPGTDRGAPGDFFTVLQPFAVLVVHRGDHMSESFVGMEEAVASGEQVALHHSNQGVFGEHLNHRSLAGEFTAVEVFR